MNTIKELPELPAFCMREYDAAAEWCAQHGFTGAIDDPLPANMATCGALRFIQADPESFQERVSQCAYALSMARVGGQP